MIVAEIDKDYINSKWDDLPNRVGKKFEMLDSYAATLPPHLPDKVRFRCKDDDGDIYYGGWLLNDSECEVQQTVLDYCRQDAGCTTIEISIKHEMLATIDGIEGRKVIEYKWVQEIG